MVIKVTKGLISYVRTKYEKHTPPDHIHVPHPGDGLWSALPFLKPNMDHAVAFRGKALPFMFGHTRIFSATAGLEYRFLQNHSIGVDAIYEWFKTPTYSWDPVTDEELQGPFKYFDVRSLHADYRYYFTPCFMEQSVFFPYVNAFTKIGTRKSYFGGYVANGYQSQDEILKRYGVSLGILLGFGRQRRYGIDFNAGLMHVSHSVDRVDYTDSGTEAVSFDLHRISGNVRLNFYCYLF